MPPVAEARWPVHAEAREDMHTLKPKQHWNNRQLPVIRAPAEPARSILLAELLTNREREVLRLLATGMRNQEIAAALVVSLATIKTHLIHIYAKLQTRNRMETVQRAHELGLL
jgi:ATP/maltotriose-dependent transcriptional regulator MalT